MVSKDLDLAAVIGFKGKSYWHRAAAQQNCQESD